jgi:hypothetical protein
MTSETPKSEPTPLEIATLAARFIPAIDLSGISPSAGGAWHPPDIRRTISELTTGKGRGFEDKYRFPEYWETPFEVIAGEAVKRARLLLDAAAGNTRQALLDQAAWESDTAASMRSQQVEIENLRTYDFPQLAKKRTTIPMLEVLKFALGRIYSHSQKNALTLMKEYLRESVLELRKKHGRPEIPVIFSNAATALDKSNAVNSLSRTGPPACIILNHSADTPVDAIEFPKLVLALRNFRDSRWPAISKNLQRAGAENGGSKTQAEDRKSKITRGENAKLTEAAKKVKKPRKDS